ncbi:hypothetical protein MG293_000415 [Ovis ammon polii]|uniref:Uncharacterized protein n=1 Tax=Ovis ammon polii TaxID=230172 RepID=A0AAD4UPR9_OVIAM|nr:hypothetical protein MG293_000415 [Ovis ammon polii]
MLVWGSDGKESVCNAEDLGLIPGSGRSSGEGNGYLLQYSSLENSMEKGTCEYTSYHETEDSVMESNYFGFKFSSGQIPDLQLKRRFSQFTQLCDPLDGGPPGSSVLGILQAKIMKCMAMLSSRESFQPRDRPRDPPSISYILSYIDRQEYRSGLPFPSPGDLPNPGIESGSPTLQANAVPSKPLRDRGSDDKVSAYNAGDLGSIPGSRSFPKEGNGNPLQYSCLENPMDRGASSSKGSIKVVLYYHTLFSNKVSTKVLIDQIGASQVALVVKNLFANAEVMDEGSILGQGDLPEEGMATQLVFLPGESHGQRSLEGYSSQDHKDSDTIEVI